MRTDYLNRNEPVTTTQATTNRWPGRIVLLFALIISFAAISQVIQLTWISGFVLGAVVGYGLQNVR